VTAPAGLGEALAACLEAFVARQALYQEWAADPTVAAAVRRLLDEAAGALGAAPDGPVGDRLAALACLYTTGAASLGAADASAARGMLLAAGALVECWHRAAAGARLGEA